MYTNVALFGKSTLARLSEHGKVENTYRTFALIPVSKSVASTRSTFVPKLMNEKSKTARTFQINSIKLRQNDCSTFEISELRTTAHYFMQQMLIAGVRFHDTHWLV